MSPFRRAVPGTPGGSNGCARRFLPHPCGLPRFVGESASASQLSRPAQASLTLRPVGSLNRPRRPSSRGFDPASCPAKTLVSDQSNRQFSGWILPPPDTRAIGAHRKIVLFQRLIVTWRIGGRRSRRSFIRLPGAVAGQHHQSRASQDMKVQPQGPVAHVIDVIALLLGQ